MGIYRCQNAKCSTDPHGRLIFDFQAPEPVCPKCKADMRKPEHRHRIVKLMEIHYHCQDDNGPDVSHHGDKYRIACGGSLAGKRATSVPWDVNCPACKASPEWKQAASENEENVLEKEDFPISVNLKDSTLEKVEG